MNENLPKYLLAAFEIFLLLLFALVLYAVDYTPYSTFDDSFIFLRYGRNLLAGEGYVWNAGEAPSDGLTAPLWLLMLLPRLAFASKQQLVEGLVQVETAFAAALLLIIVLYKSTQALLPYRFKGLAVLPVMYLWLSPFNLGYHIRSGMETLLAAALIAGYFAVMYMGSRRPEEWSRGHAIGAGLLGFLLITVRPEMGLIALGVPGLGWIIGLRRETPHARLCYRVLLTTIVVLLAYGLWRLHYFGDVFPLPFYIKGSLWNFPYIGYNEKAWQNTFSGNLYYFKDTAWLHLLFFAGLLHRKRFESLFFLWAPLYLMIAYLTTTFQLMGWAFRYAFPGVAAHLLLLLMAWRDEEEHEWTGGLTTQRLFAEGFFAFYYVGIGLSFTTAFWTTAREYAIKPVKTGRYDVVYRLDALPEDTNVALTEVGVMGVWPMHVRLHDLAGLTDRRFAMGFSKEEFYRRNPEIITVVHLHYEGMTAAITEDPRFERYELVVDLAPSQEKKGLQLGMWLNKEAPNADRLRRILLLTDPPGEEPQAPEGKKELLEKLRGTKWNPLSSDDDSATTAGITLRSEDSPENEL